MKTPVGRTFQRSTSRNGPTTSHSTHHRTAPRHEQQDGSDTVLVVKIGNGASKSVRSKPVKSTFVRSFAKLKRLVKCDEESLKSESYCIVKI